MFWTVVLCTAMWILGAIVGAYGLIQALICIRCGKKYTNLLLKRGNISEQNASLVKKHHYFVISRSPVRVRLLAPNKTPAKCLD